MEALRFTRDHLWVRIDGRQARIGLSEHGQVTLGEIKAVELPEIGDAVERGEAFGELESLRTVAELFAPVSGTVTAINTDLEDSPSLVNDDPHHDGWLVEVDLSDPDELDELMSAEQYEALVDDE
ncbi:MAG TPA: glycine cleavage system protein GcvH [Candidatus Binatia bacterium]|nr:glycine cleavage system protein GcvH [Candidatus Binatia bacterium]